METRTCPADHILSVTVKDSSPNVLPGVTEAAVRFDDLPIAGWYGQDEALDSKCKQSCVKDCSCVSHCSWVVS